MATKSNADNNVTLIRGGKEVKLFKSETLFAVRLKSGEIVENLPGRISRDTKLPSSVRFVTKYPGQRIGIFHCRKADRDDVMKQLRGRTDLVQYCSHIYNRREDEDLPGAEIALDNKIFIEFKKKTDRNTIRKVEDKHNLRAIWSFPEGPGGVIFELTENATENPIKIATKLFNTKSYKTVEPCLIEAKVGRAIPNDSGFRNQWHLLNTGQDGGVPGADCNAVLAWDYTWGSPDITVALIDDGFDLEHPDFDQVGKVHAPYDATQHDTDPSPAYFSEKHGTACAGVAVARQGGGVAVGIAPDCTMMPIRHAGRLGDYDEALAFYHAFKNDADIISCSWGPPDAFDNSLWPLPSLTRYVIDICVELGRDGKGIPIFFAAGNGNESLDLDGYANYENVIAVGAITNEDLRSYYSDYGENVWVTAPSSGGTTGIFTTDRMGSEGYNSFSDYTANFGGTSSSTPLVAGIAALMLSVNPDLTVAEVKQILKDTAVKINFDDPQVYEDYWENTFSDEYNSDGHSQVFGWGRVDAGAAVEEALRMRP